MDIVITNVNGYTTISVKGKKAHIRQKREDFLKEDFNVFLKSIHQKNTIVNNITHDKAKLTANKEIGFEKWQQGTGEIIEKGGEHYE